MTHWIGWLELVAEQVLLVAAFLVVFEGCRRLARDGMTSRAALMVAIGLIPPAADATLSLSVMKSVRSLQADKMAAVAAHGREPAGGWEKAAASPQERTALSYQAATVAYLFEGRHIEVIDDHGARTPFVPAIDQEGAREQFLRDEKAAESSAQASYEHGMRLFVEAAGFMLAGVVVGWRQRSRA